MEKRRIFPETRIAMCKCKEGGTYGVRFEKGKYIWNYNWAFPMKEEIGKRENYDEEIKGTIEMSDEYPGCPYCKAKAFIICGNCGKLNCNMHSTGNKSFTCGWCNFTGMLSDYDGAGIKSGSDR